MECSVCGNEMQKEVSDGTSKNKLEETYDVVVVGAGHAGCEAALACARLGLETIIFTVSVDSIALMPCNPNIGGSSKGHLVREVDALGGQMGINIDKTFIQSKMLNRSKGPAVHSLRAQADKADYSMEMRQTLQNTEHLTIKQAEVAEIITELYIENSPNKQEISLKDNKDISFVEFSQISDEQSEESKNNKKLNQNMEIKKIVGSG